MRLAVIAIATTTFLASSAWGQEPTLGSLIAGDQSVTQMSVVEVNADKVHVLLLLEGDEGGFLCKVEALAVRDELTPLLKQGSFPDILGLRTSDASKWRNCAKIY